MQAYVDSLEKFCMYTINDKIASFYEMAENPRLILKQRERTAIYLFSLESLCLKYQLKQNTGTILKLSEYFYDGKINDEDLSDHHVLNSTRDDFSQPVKDIDRLICKGLCEELCDPESTRNENLSEEQVANALTELRKPLRHIKSKSGGIIVGKIRKRSN